MNKVTINGKEFTIKMSLNAFLVFESLTGRTCKGDTLSDLCILLYSMLLAHNDTFDMEFDAFITYLDGDCTLLAKMSDFIMSEIEEQKKA